MAAAVDQLRAPFPYFGGKSKMAALVWERFGTPAQYIEPFCGSAAVLLRAPRPASLEVVNDCNGYIANFWRALKHQPEALIEWADYPVSHIDLGARHRWLTDPERTKALSDALQDPDWPGDAKLAGWWLWGQCCWIGSGWCDWFCARPAADRPSAEGAGVQAVGRIPHAGSAGRGIQAVGKGGWMDWLRTLSARLARVRVGHGNWDRFLNHQYGGSRTAVFLDPPYRGYCEPYGAPEVADKVEAWARDNAALRVALCGHAGDYDLPGWEVHPWRRASATMGSSKTTDKECIWFSPACLHRPTGPLDIEI